VTLDQTIEATVRRAVTEAVEPLVRKLDAIDRRQTSAPVSVAEAARRMGVSERTVRRRVSDGDLTATGSGRWMRVTLRE
jgi:excisionase family DNA binding protein